MTTETMREAVARAMDTALRAMESDARVSELTDDEVRAITDAAIRTVLERLREPSEALLRVGVLEMDAVSDDPDAYPPTRKQMKAGWQAMLDAAAREVA